MTNILSAILRRTRVNKKNETIKIKPKLQSTQILWLFLLTKISNLPFYQAFNNGKTIKLFKNNKIFMNSNLFVIYNMS